MTDLKKDATFYVDHPNSINYYCQACASQPGEKCTVPTENGHKKVSWYHYARSGLVMDSETKQRPSDN